MKYAFYEDPSHGWLKVPVEEIKQLGITHQISQCSYISADRKFAFLEEDMDAETFLKAAVIADWFPNTTSVKAEMKFYHTNSSSFIRTLDSFSVFLENEIPPFQSKIFNF